MLSVSPFDQLRTLLGDTPPGAAPIDMSVGSPRHAPPRFVVDEIARHAGAWGGYPPLGGTPAFQRAVFDWLDRRYRLGGALRETVGVVPLSGSREGLVLAAVTARDLLAKARPAIVFANPYYAAYPAAAHVTGAEPVPLATRGIVADWDAVPAATLDRATVYYATSPSNPGGVVATADDWHAVFDRAERHDFLVFADECYSEIYREGTAPPVGALEVARDRPEALDRLVVFNSLSKRSNLAGLRVGFLAAGRRLLPALRALRNVAAPHVPAPLQDAAALAYADEAHVAANRRLYDTAFAIAEDALAPVFGTGFGRVTPDGGFSLWLPVADDLALGAALWREAGVRVLPGRFLAMGGPAGSGANPGVGRLRLALVDDPATTKTAFSRIAAVFSRHEGATLGSATLVS